MTSITLQERFSIATLIGAAGGSVAAAILWEGQYPNDDIGFIRVATAGAFLAGLVVARGFGGSGGWGVALSVLSFVGATVLGALLAVMLMPVEGVLAQIGVFQSLRELALGSVLGPFYVLDMITSEGAVWSAWGISILGVHGASALLRG